MAADVSSGYLHFSTGGAQALVQLGTSENVHSEMSATRKQIVQYLAVRGLVQHVIDYYAKLWEPLNGRIRILQFLYAVAL